MKKLLKKENRIVLFALLFSFGIMFLVINYTYAFFKVDISDNSIIAGESDMLSIDLTVDLVSSGKGKLIPQLGEYISSAIKGRNGSCVDDNNNTVCQVYKISLVNNSSSSIYLDGVLSLNGSNNPNLKWAIISNFVEGEKPNVVGNTKSFSDYILSLKDLYSSSEEKNYYIVLWINEIGLSQNDSGIFNGVVNFSQSEPISLASNELYSLGILPNDEILVNFTSSSKIDETTGVYKTNDDLGTSYYFRGDVTNNYVKFGKNSDGNDMYWRIVRINGDGTIRIIYDGTQLYENGITSKDKQIGTLSFNEYDNDNAYMGFMYGAIDATSYENTHENITNSIIKTYLENWYENNIFDTGYDSYVADAIYCNDRTRVTDDDFNTKLGATGEGFDNYVTLYSLYRRTFLTDNGYPSSISPSLICERSEDKFTKNENIGNAKLSYPIGLLTVDEAAFAGANWAIIVSSNNEMYLYNGNNDFWIMSAGDFYGGSSCVFYLLNGSFNSKGASDQSGVRPVLSLNSGAIIKGNGTITNPYAVE